MTNLKQVIETCTKKIKSPLDLAEAQYTENFLDIADEIAKLQSISGEKPNYEAIISKSQVVLSEEAKHIKPICYLIFALYQFEKEKGLSAGLEILAISLEQLADDIYPNKKKKRARAASFEWLRKQLLELIERIDASNIQQEQLEKIVECSKKIKEWMLEYCEDQAISFFNTFKQYQNALEEKHLKQESKEKEKVQKAKEEAEKLEMAQIAKEKTEIKSNVADEELDDLFDLPSEDDFMLPDVESGMDEAFTTENIYPAFLNHLQKMHLPFNIDPLQAEVFDTHRTLLWGQAILELTELSVRIDETTYPTADYDIALKNYQEGQFEEALTAFETLFFKVPFHFDIQYYQIQCILKLVNTSQSNKIISTIKAKLRNLLKNNLALLEHKYPDGPQCASPHVSEWIINDVLCINSFQSNQLTEIIIRNDPHGRSPTTEISDRYRHSHSFKEKLNLQLNLALNLKEEGQDKMALNILEQAYKKLTAKALVFELIPQLASQICLHLWASYDAIEEDKTQEQMAQQQLIFSTISKYCPEKFDQDQGSALDIETESE